MNKHVNPPCISSLATSFNIEIFSSTKDEVGITSLFGGSVASDERELAIHEGVAASSWVPSFHFVPGAKVVVREGEECLRRALEKIEASDGRVEEASGGDSFADSMGSFEKETGGESEGFTFADILQRADLLSDTVLEGVFDTLDLPFC